MLRKYTDLLAILMGVVIIPGMWILQGFGLIDISGLEILGATIAIETMIAQYYFRKKPPANNA